MLDNESRETISEKEDEADVPDNEKKAWYLKGTTQNVAPVPRPKSKSLTIGMI